MFNILQSLLISDGSIIVNRALVHKLGLHEAIIYSELLSKNKYYAEKKQLKEEWFFSTADDLHKSTGLSRYQQDKAISVLSKYGLIEYKLEGMPARRYFKVIKDTEKLVKLLKSSSFKETCKQDLKKLENLVKETCKQDLKKLEPNNNNRIITTNDNNNNLSSTPEQVGGVDEVVKKWNALGLNAIRAVNHNTNRYKLLKARLKEFGLEDVLKAIENTEKSSFLKGQNDRGWTITFDWLIKPNNFLKVLEGNYTDKGGDSNGSSSRDVGNGGEFEYW